MVHLAARVVHLAAEVVPLAAKVAHLIELARWFIWPPSSLCEGRQSNGDLHDSQKEDDPAGRE